MKTPAESHNFFFVDESGDTTFYNKRGKLIVGRNGCSKIFLLGFVQSNQPARLRKEVTAFQNQVANSPVYKDIPSIAKTRVALHAKDDYADIRLAFFHAMAQLDFKAQVIVARKHEHVFRANHAAGESHFYDSLVTQLFQNVLHLNAHNTIVFAKRGSRDRQQPLLAAIQQAKGRFQRRWNTEVKTETTVMAQTPAGEACLCLTDYINWAVYRAYTRREMEYFDLIAHNVSLVVDMYTLSKSGTHFYSRKNPFHIDKTTPL